MRRNVTYRISNNEVDFSVESENASSKYHCNAHKLVPKVSMCDDGDDRAKENVNCNEFDGGLLSAGNSLLN
jgi:hypothetical protein